MFSLGSSFSKLALTLCLVGAVSAEPRSLLQAAAPAVVPAAPLVVAPVAPLAPPAVCNTGSVTSLGPKSSCAWRAPGCLKCPNRCVVNRQQIDRIASQDVTQPEVNTAEECLYAWTKRWGAQSPLFNSAVRPLSVADASKLMGCLTLEDVTPPGGVPSESDLAEVAKVSAKCSPTTPLTEEQAALYNKSYNTFAPVPAGTVVCSSKNFDFFFRLKEAESTCQNTSVNCPGDLPDRRCTLSKLGVLAISTGEATKFADATAALHNDCGGATTEAACLNFEPASTALLTTTLASVVAQSCVTNCSGLLPPPAGVVLPIEEAPVAVPVPAPVAVASASNEPVSTVPENTATRTQLTVVAVVLAALAVML